MALHFVFKPETNAGKDLSAAQQGNQSESDKLGLTSADVVALSVTGRIDLPERRRLMDAIGQARGRARCLAADLSALRFEPTSDDIGALRADGYLGDVIASLRAAQEGAPTESADVARDALALLAGILDERRVSARAAP